MAKVSFNNKNNIFYNALKKEVEDYFRQRHIQKTGNWKLYLKTGILIPLAVGLYLFLLFFNIPSLPAILMCGTFGFILACIGFNIMHDACHGSFSRKIWVNNLGGLTLNALGGTAFFWKQKHNIIHHTYPNIDGIDEDIARSPVIRLCETQKWVPAHRIQHIYVPLVYAITSLAWTFIMDPVKYFRKKVLAINLTGMNMKQHIIFWISKFMYIFFYIALPVIMVGWKAWAIGFISMHVVLGFTLAIVFQLAHVVEHTEFEVAGVQPKLIESEWAVYQVKTTANFAPKNKIISWLVGGLNFQIEHHLFPRVSHVHYPALSKIVQRTCQRFNMPYHQFPTMTSAIASHFRMMKRLGRKPVM